MSSLRDSQKATISITSPNEKAINHPIELEETFYSWTSDEFGFSGPNMSGTLFWVFLNRFWQLFFQQKQVLRYDFGKNEQN